MGRKRKLSSKAAFIQHRGPSFSLPVPTIIFEPQPVIIQTTEKLFKDHVQLLTGSPKTQAAATARLGYDPPPRRPPYSHYPNPSCSPQSVSVIPDPSLKVAIIPFKVPADGQNPRASSTTSATDFSTISDSGIPIAFANTLSPSSTSSIFDMLNSYLMSDDDLHNIAASSSFVPYSSTTINVVPYQHNEELLLVVGDQNIPPDPSLLAIVPFQNNKDILLAADGQNSQEYSSCIPPNPSLPTIVPFQHNKEDNLGTDAPMVSVDAFSPLASSSIWDIHTTPALKPSSLAKLVNSNSGANIVNRFLMDDNDWSWLSDHIL